LVGNHRRKTGDKCVAGGIVLRRQDLFGVATLGRGGFRFPFAADFLSVELLQQDRKRDIGGRDRLRCRETLLSRGRKYRIFGLPARQAGLRLPVCLFIGKFGNRCLPIRVGGCSIRDRVRRAAGRGFLLRAPTRTPRRGSAQPPRSRAAPEPRHWQRQVVSSLGVFQHVKRLGSAGS
jgi:hypothetical protein